jgi:hypothetical protein
LGSILATSSYTNPSWQTSSLASPFHQDSSLWTDFRDQASSSFSPSTNIHKAGQTEWDTMGTRSPYQFDLSFSPTSPLSINHPNLTDAELYRILSNHNMDASSTSGSAQLLSDKEPFHGSGLSHTVRSSHSQFNSSPLPKEHFPHYRNIHTGIPASQSSLHTLPEHYPMGSPLVSTSHPLQSGKSHESFQATPHTPSSSAHFGTRDESARMTLGTRSLSARGSHASLVSTSLRPRAGTMSASSSYSRIMDQKPPNSFSASSATMERIQEDPVNRSTGSGISASLSAELAGLGLNISNFYPVEGTATGDTLMSNVEPGLHYDESTRSSTSIDQGRRKGQDGIGGDSSFLSHATSSFESSELDNSLVSLDSSVNQSSDSSRWIHGKDTPPTSPATSFGSRLRPSPLLEQRKDGSMDNLLQQAATALPYARPNEFGSLRRNAQSGGTDWFGSWPPKDVAGTKAVVLPLQESRRNSFGLPPPTERRSHRLTSSSSTQSLQERRLKRHPRSALNAPSALEKKTSAASSRRSNDSLQSDIGPSRSNKIASKTLGQQRGKRFSTSFLTDREARQRNHEEQNQLDQVSDALDTLRRFLRQREKSTLSSTPPPSSRPISFAGSSGASVLDGMAFMGEQVSHVDVAPSISHPTNHSRKLLRHPPPGPLPPRGSVDTPLTPSQHSPALSLSHASTSEEAERIAAIEDLAKRVRQMRDDRQRSMYDQ